MEKTHSWCVLQTLFGLLPVVPFRGGDSRGNLSKYRVVLRRTRCKDTKLNRITKNKVREIYRMASLNPLSCHHHRVEVGKRHHPGHLFSHYCRKRIAETCCLRQEERTYLSGIQNVSLGASERISRGLGTYLSLTCRSAGFVIRPQ